MFVCVVMPVSVCVYVCVFMHVSMCVCVCVHNWVHPCILSLTIQDVSSSHVHNTRWHTHTELTQTHTNTHITHYTQTVRFGVQTEAKVMPGSQKGEGFCVWQWLVWSWEYNITGYIFYMKHFPSSGHQRWFTMRFLQLKFGSKHLYLLLCMCACVCKGGGWMGYVCVFTCVFYVCVCV